jgi:hypothetical protein
VGETKTAYRILVGKPEGKKPLGTPRRRWVDNIKIDLREIEWDGMVWTGSIWLKIFPVYLRSIIITQLSLPA